MTLASPLPEAFGNRLLRHWSELIRLAWPVMLSRLGILLMALVDAVMLGRFDTVAFAGFALGLSIFLPIMVTGIGGTVGVVSVVARHHGAGRTQAAAESFFHGLWWATLVGIFVAVLSWQTEHVLTLVGQAPELREIGGAVGRTLAFGGFCQILFAASAFYLEATKRPLPALIAMIGANVVNAILNLLALNGTLPFIGQEAVGVAFATSTARTVLAITLLAYVACLPEVRAAASRMMWGPGGWPASREIRTIGLAGAAAYFFETFAFSALNQAAGLIGTSALAAYSIAHNVESTVFMIAIGLSVASAVRVGSYAGQGRADEARFAAWSGLALTALIIGSIGVLIVLNGERVASVYTEDAALIARITPLLAILTIALVFDGGQVVMGHCTRALGDSWGTTLRFFLAFWGVMIPVGLYLGLATSLEEMGLFVGTGVGCGVAVLLLGLRFAALVRRTEDKTP
ncbi:MAG: MATE family efflux transporter [Pseudomonadota bacterium]